MLFFAGVKNHHPWVNQFCRFGSIFRPHGEIIANRQQSIIHFCRFAKDESFTKLATAFTTDFEVFYQRVIKDMERYKNKRAFEVQ